MVGSIVAHRRGHDHEDLGFEVVAHVPEALSPSDVDSKDLRSFSHWKGWRDYLNRQDQLLSEQPGSA